MTVPLTLAICSNRLPALCAAVTRTLQVIGEDDVLVVVIDQALDPSAGIQFEAALQDARVRVILNDGNLGLSRSRNRAMKEAPTRHVLFVDDDITVGQTVVEELRHVLAGGVHVVGARITADFGSLRRPWFLTSGQLHYLGCHDPGRPASIWGGCFAVDVTEARLLGVTFDECLGRTGTSLASAEDTTFVAQLTGLGAVAHVLQHATVAHLVPDRRLRLSYLLRRAYWQGRSEVRRKNAARGLQKEWTRNRPLQLATAPRRTLLALLYTGAVAAGTLHEAAQQVAAPYSPHSIEVHP